MRKLNYSREHIEKTIAEFRKEYHEGENVAERGRYAAPIGLSLCVMLEQLLAELEKK